MYRVNIANNFWNSEYIAYVTVRPRGDNVNRSTYERYTELKKLVHDTP